MGDPHITTLDGKHYTLLSQGTFSLWHFSGLETELHSEEVGTKKLPIDWQVYVHYSGHQSFTKGLLLIDKSGGSIRQVLEITSQDCRWQARKGNGDWKVVDNAELSIPDGKDYVTAFDLGGSSRSWWPWLSQPCSLQHEDQEWQVGHSSHESQLQTKPQPESPNLNETPERPEVCRW